MHIGVLGDLEVRTDDGADVLVKGAKLRALLAVLALHVGRSVPADQLVEAVWGEDPPPAVRNGLQGLVSKLRSALGSTTVVAMRGGGYALDLPAESIDADRFEQLVAAGRAAAAAGNATHAIELLREAGSLWRGDALVEFAYEDFAAAEISRLSEMRLAAVEERLHLELQLGRHRATISELDALVTAHPLRERPRGLLMIAMYRSGRQADALRVFQDGRRLLADELGLDPSPELRQLESAILAQDPSLGGPASDAPTPPPIPADPRCAIPPALTPLVGREEEVRVLTGLLHEHRFVTLVGPGGVGKTRLAIEVARERSATLTGGACLVELAPVGDPVGVRGAVATALDLPDPGRLAEMIGDRALLIVLDNCEHVIGAAAGLAEDLLRRCPGLHLLATSREGLRVGGETIWPVPPLAIDDAAQLFIARARAAGARLSGEVLTTVSEICARLDGLPLAIELAAARTRAFSIEQISSRLTDRFRLLTGGSRTALPRQQTLRAVVDWSYELLFDDEQKVFERLAVFPGGCDLATAEAVCADETLDASDLADIASALVEKSLVVAVPTGDGVRFTQLQTLAQYGREKLAERGDSQRIRDAMAAHFARLCAGSAAAFIGEGQRAWLVALDREQDNIRGALEWAVANEDAETALTIAGGASWQHWLAGTSVEGKRWLDGAFSCAGDATAPARALALVGRGLTSFQLGEPAGVDADLTTALEIFREHGDVASMTLTYSFYAEVAAARGDRDEAHRRREEVLDFYRRLPDDAFVAGAIAYSQGKIATLHGDLEQAERYYRAAADGFSRTDRPMMRSMCLGMIADFEERSGDVPAAIASLEDAIAINDELGLRGFNGALLARLGWAWLRRGDLGRAETILTRSLDVGRRLTHTSVIFTALSALAVVHQRCDRPEAASAAASEALQLAAASGPRRLSNRVDAQADVDACITACQEVLGRIGSRASVR